VALVLVTVAVAVGAPLLVDHGGKVLTTPQVTAIYLGDYWATQQGASDALYTDTFLQTWLAGPSVTGVLAQYRIVSASFASSDKVAAASPAQFTDADAQALVQQEIAAGRVVNGPQTIHVVYLPPGTVLTFQGASSLNKLGAYHSSYRDAGTGNPVYYAVVVYGQGTNGIDFNGNPQDAISIMTSYALAGAMTDPDLGDVARGASVQGTIGWRDDTLGDIGDIAFNLSTDPALGDVWVVQDGFAVELLWSNAEGKLSAGASTTTGPASQTSTILSVSPASQNALQGATVIYTVASVASATDTFALSVSGLPAEVTGTFAQTSLAPGGTTTLTLSVAPGAANGTTSFTVTGTGLTSTQSASASLTVGTVTDAGATPPPAAAPSRADFTLSVTPTTQPIVSGGEAVTFTISSGRTFRTDTVIKLEAQRIPKHMRANLSSRVIAAGESVTLTIVARRKMPGGIREITIKGKSRRGTQRVTISLVVHKPRRG
jgi:hypothetical protein